jgi:hypothetical protein
MVFSFQAMKLPRLFAVAATIGCFACLLERGHRLIPRHGWGAQRPDGQQLDRPAVMVATAHHRQPPGQPLLHQGGFDVADFLGRRIGMAAWPVRPRIVPSVRPWSAAMAAGSVPESQRIFP